MTIGNNLARAFGLVGAMSIIRFRTAVKDTQDIIFIFFSLAIGMTAGVGLHALAIVGTLFIGLVSVLLAKTDFVTHSKKDFLLQFNFDGNTGSTKNYEDVMNKYCKRIKLINVRSLGPDGQIEMSFHINFKSQSQSMTFISKLNQVKGLSRVNLFFDEEYF
jgi:uncharacterized membrane protein YhiD involved in acid resistance